MTEHLAALAARPRLRGWLHVWAFAVSAVAGLVLVAVAGSTRGAQAALGHLGLRADRDAAVRHLGDLPPGALVDPVPGGSCWPGSTTR